MPNGPLIIYSQHLQRRTGWERRGRRHADWQRKVPDFPAPCDLKTRIDRGYCTFDLIDAGPSCVTAQAERWALENSSRSLTEI